MTENSKTVKQNPKRQKNISAALIRSIALILIISVFLPIVAYYFLPDWVYYLTGATRLFFAGTSITESFDDPDILDILRDAEIRYNSTVEVYDDSDRLIYSTAADRSGEKIDIKNGLHLAESYRIPYKITEGTVRSSGYGYLLRQYDTSAFSITFLEFYSHTNTGERIEICMQVSETTIVSKIEILVIFIFFMLCLIFAMLVIMQYVKNFTKHVKKMVEVTDKMSRLDFSEKCPPGKYVEFEQLGNAINEMSGSLDSALTELKTRNEKLQQDIDNERTIDELRKTFINGISHELKTPIAIIAGYAEGAKTFYAAGNTEIADNYCDTISQEADRMNNMIMKLLEITRYDSGAYEPVSENFNIHDEVQEWFDRNAEILKEKSVTVINDIPKGAVVSADRFLVASNINNYLSNAVSHVDGEKIIRASLRIVDGKSRIYIDNTGEPIADRDIEKIWTSFYRADKSLSRKQGRFGLGLATVASIQKLHNEKYGVENLENGVRFWFDAKTASFTDELSPD